MRSFNIITGQCRDVSSFLCWYLFWHFFLFTGMKKFILLLFNIVYIFFRKVLYFVANYSWKLFTKFYCFSKENYKFVVHIFKQMLHTYIIDICKHLLDFCSCFGQDIAKKIFLLEIALKISKFSGKVIPNDRHLNGYRYRKICRVESVSKFWVTTVGSHFFNFYLFATVKQLHTPKNICTQKCYGNPRRFQKTAEVGIFWILIISAIFKWPHLKQREKNWEENRFSVDRQALIAVRSEIRQFFPEF